MQNETGKLALHFCGVLKEVQVLQSAAGFYIGTAESDGSPFSRESKEYWRSKREADEALTLGRWTQKPEP
jgi:hypothetical protein